jgi:hypothetical protein
MKRPELVDLCREFSLGVVGNMPELKEKLHGFSENIIRWQKKVFHCMSITLLIDIALSLIPGARRAHRGVREGGIMTSAKKENVGTAAKKTKKLKLSTIRRHELMGTPLDASGAPQRFAAERSKDMRTLAEKNELWLWVCDRCFLFGI